MVDKAKVIADFNSGAAPYQYTPQKTPSPGLVDFYDKVTKKGGHVFLGDPHIDATSLRTYELLANNPDLFKKSAQNGIKHVILELPVSYQDSVDSYLAGRINETDLSDRFSDFRGSYIKEQDQAALQKNIVQTIRNANESGLQVHTADISSTETFYKFYELMEAKKNGVSEDEHIKRINEFQKARFNDTAQLNYLESRIPHGERMIGFVGVNHLTNPQEIDTGIDDLLRQRGDSVTTISVETEKSNIIKKHYSDMYKAPEKQPTDYAIDLNTGEIQDRNNNGNIVGNMRYSNPNTSRHQPSVQHPSFVP